MSLAMGDMIERERETNPGVSPQRLADILNMKLDEGQD